MKKKKEEEEKKLLVLRANPRSDLKAFLPLSTQRFRQNQRYILTFTMAITDEAPIIQATQDIQTPAGIKSRNLVGGIKAALPEGMESCREEVTA